MSFRISNITDSSCDVIGRGRWFGRKTIHFNNLNIPANQYWYKLTKTQPSFTKVPYETNDTNELDLTIPSAYSAYFNIPSLWKLIASSLTLRIIDFTCCSSLQHLSVSYNALSYIDVSNCSDLMYLDCSYNSNRSKDFDKPFFGSLNLSSNKKLQEIYCNGNNIASLKSLNAKNLYWLDCSSNDLTDLDVSHSPKLEVLICNFNKLESIYMPPSDNNTYLSPDQAESLKAFFCNDNKLTNLNINYYPALYDIECQNNSLINLSFSNQYLKGNNSLSWLDCHQNNLSTLDLTKFDKLENLNFSQNKINYLNVKDLHSLSTINCSINSLYLLDLQGCDHCYSIECQGNQLQLLDASDCHLLSNCYFGFQSCYIVVLFPNINDQLVIDIDTDRGGYENLDALHYECKGGVIWVGANTSFENGYQYHFSNTWTIETYE